MYVIYNVEVYYYNYYARFPSTLSGLVGQTCNGNSSHGVLAEGIFVGVDYKWASCPSIHIYPEYDIPPLIPPQKGECSDLLRRKSSFHSLMSSTEVHEGREQGNATFQLNVIFSKFTVCIFLNY